MKNDDDFKGQLYSREDISNYILTPKTETGSAIFTLAFKDSAGLDQRFTYKVSYKSGEETHNHKSMYFVKVLTGADNSNSYTYLGYLQDNGLFWKHDNKQRIGYEAPSAKTFRWLIRQVFTWKKNDLGSRVEFWHEGCCGRCGRRLTVPISVATGFGPDCAGQIGILMVKVDTKKKVFSHEELKAKIAAEQINKNAFKNVDVISQRRKDKLGQSRSKF